MSNSTKIAVLPAANGDGSPINGSHRVLVTEIRAISPMGDGGYSVVFLDRWSLTCALPANEAAKILGWD